MLALSILVLARLFWLSTAIQSDVADVGYAKYVGNRTNSNTVAYLGIPYAEPPVGNLRFKATVPLNTTRVKEQNHGKVVEAQEYPNFCIQGSTGGGDAGGAGSEDCLNVNIYAPADASTGSTLPVLVYIHGGGYVYGNPRNWPFDHWIHQSPNVVIVSVYYRLDSFGFLSHPSFGTSSHQSSLGDLNAGFLDQIQALKWVKGHISAFGGDPSQVTINGESAGGSSVELHLVANEGEALFSQAIAQSVYRTPVPTPQQQEALFTFYSEQAGCGTGSIIEQMACLRNASVSALARAQDAASANVTGYNSFHPVIDGDVIADIPTKLITTGKFKAVPLIVGATSNETLSSATSVTTALQAFFPALSQADLAQFTDVYTANNTDGGNLFRVATGESELRCARTIMATAFSEVPSLKAWTYRYNQPNPTSNDTAVEHAAENWMMFLGTNTGFNGTTTFSSMTPIETQFASELIAYWLSFVRSGNPNTFKLSPSPSWPSYGMTQRNRIVLQQALALNQSGSYVEEEPSDETSRCQFVAGKESQEQN